MLEKETVLQKLQLSFFPTCFLCVERIFKFFGDTNFLTLRFHGAMCFASGSIFGNKFLTPAGMKTLFPIFENTLCGKVLAGKTRTPIFKKTKDV